MQCTRRFGAGHIQERHTGVVMYRIERQAARSVEEIRNKEIPAPAYRWVEVTRGAQHVLAGAAIGREPYAPLMVEPERPGFQGDLLVANLDGAFGWIDEEAGDRVVAGAQPADQWLRTVVALRQIGPS